jgi:hypothetical protein
MSRRRSTQQSGSLADEAARVICEEAVTDYRLAKRKAAERLGLPPNVPQPDNARVEAAVIEYQRLYGGNEYADHLRAMRQVAVRAMRLLSSFEPRLVGGTVTGAVSTAHRVQLHAFADKAELLDVFLQDRGIPFEADERDYRYADGSVASIPLVRFVADAIGVDVAVFSPDELRQPPLSPTSGQITKRLTLADAERLAAAAIDILPIDDP